jgi:hypothetical protein
LQNTPSAIWQSSSVVQGVISTHPSSVQISPLGHVLVCEQVRSTRHVSSVQSSPSSQSPSLEHSADTQPRSGSHDSPSAHSESSAACSQQPPTTHVSLVHAMESSQSAWPVQVSHPVSSPTSWSTLVSIEGPPPAPPQPAASAAAQQIA